MTLYLVLLIGTIITAGVFVSKDAYGRGYEHGRNESEARRKHPSSRNVRVVTRDE